MNFDGASFIDVFVGKNGTGKSNLFEALIEIFRHVVEYDREKEDLCVGGSKIVFKSDSEKTAFAKEVVHTLDVACFEVFRPMFGFIKSKS